MAVSVTVAPFTGVVLEAASVVVVAAEVVVFVLLVLDELPQPANRSAPTSADSITTVPWKAVFIGLLFVVSKSE